MGDELRVDTNDLRAKANEINALQWATPADEPPITPPSALTTSVDAATALAKAAYSVWTYQNWGVTEGKRLAESLYHVGKAYDEVDLRAKSEINAGRPISNGPVKPDPVSIPAAPKPDAPGMPGKPGHAHGDPEAIENALKNGDQGAALRTVASFWRTTGNKLQTAAEPFQVKIANWEGAAAEAAYGRFNGFGGWLHSLAGTWQQLGAEADKVADAHTRARADHTPIYDQWMALKKKLDDASDDDKEGIVRGLAKLYLESEQVRGQYESAAAIDKVQPPEPGDGAGPSIPVNTNGDPRQPAVPAGKEGTEGAGQQPGAGGGGGQPGGGAGGTPQGTPSTAGTPVGQTATPQQAKSGGTSAGGGGQGGGKSGGGKGGGMPGGGLPGGIPAAAKATPHLPKGPNVRPAGTGGGGGAGSGGGGGGGGPHPLQPAVAGTAVAASPTPPVEHGAEAAKAGPGGAMGAGMGGMPMGGHGGQGGSKERPRTPGLTPDEELYKEDRAWTEGVIGARRRRESPDSKEST